MRWRRLKTETNRLTRRSPYRTLINIGEDWVRALVVELGPDGTHVIGGAREKRRGPYTLNSVECVADLCERAVSKAERATESTVGYRVVADHGLLGVPDTWSTMASGTVKHHRREPERKMDAAELRAVLERAVTFVLSQQGENEARASDGQRISDPVGFRGEELGLSIFLSLVGRERTEYLREIAYELGLDPVRLVPLLQALAVSLPASEALGILLDDSHTDVFRLLNRRVVASCRVAQGVQHMVLGIADALGIAPRDARRLQRAHRRGLLKPEQADLVEEELLRQMWRWAVHVRPAVKNMGEDGIPAQVYLCGAGEGMKSLRAMLASPEWQKGLNFVRHPQIACFGPGDVAPVLDRTGELHSLGDLGMRCLAVYAQAEAQPHSRVDVLLEQVLRDRGYTYSE